jgi:DNA-binding response OmpR family regulator
LDGCPNAVHPVFTHHSSHVHTVLHLCLVGQDITGQHRLVDHLRTRHVVTLIAEGSWLTGSALARHSDVLALEADPKGAAWRAHLRALHTALPIVLVDGDLTDDEKAEAFELGALDFFPAPCEVALLAERLEVLARAQRAASAIDAPGTDPGGTPHESAA